MKRNTNTKTDTNTTNTNLINTCLGASIWPHPMESKLHSINFFFFTIWKQIWKEIQIQIQIQKYKCDKYLLRSKYMTPPNGVKVDGHIPSSTNAWKLLSCLLLGIGKVEKNHSFILHPDYMVKLMHCLKNKWILLNFTHDIDDDEVEPQMDNRRDLARGTWCVVVESLFLWFHCFALNGGWKSESWYR